MDDGKPAYWSVLYEYMPASIMDQTGMAAAARLHVAALTESGLSRESLLQALLEEYDGQGPSGMSK